MLATKNGILKNAKLTKRLTTPDEAMQSSGLAYIQEGSIPMNRWTQLSIDFANQRDYLDQLFKVYPTIPEGLRDIDNQLWGKVEHSFQSRNNELLVRSLLELDLFPIKDSYVAYLRRDPNSIRRNPETINRIAGRLYEMGLDKIFERCSEPKETNRQIGPMFRDWLRRNSLGVPVLPKADFIEYSGNCVLDASDAEMMVFARERLNYTGEKGLDFVGKFGGEYVVGEAKFLTDFGGHQNAQFEDAKNLIRNGDIHATKIAILDGVLYITGNSRSGNKMYRYLVEHQGQYNIMSALVLREFLFTL